MGYNPRDRSISQSIYLVYVVIFFSLWGFSMLALAADQGAFLLSMVHGYPATTVSTRALLIWIILELLIRGYKSGKQSPFIFSEADGELICQTPAKRGQVGLAWYFGDWTTNALVFGAFAIILRFASLEIVEQRQVAWADLPRFMLAGLQAAIIILPIYAAIMAMVYTLGALRLQGDNDIPWLRWITAGVITLLGALWLSSQGIVAVVLFPLVFPLAAAFSEVPWFGGFLVAIGLAVASIWVLYISSSRLNLSRAAQESRFRGSMQQVRWLGDSQIYREMARKERLGIGHRASRVPGKRGAWVLMWKDWISAMRKPQLGDLFGWLVILGLVLGIILAQDWGMRLWSFILGCYLLGQRSTERLRADLRVWTISRQLAIRSKTLLLAEIASAVILTTLLAWLAMLISSLLGYAPEISYFILVPFVIISISLSGVFDILRQSRSSSLLAGFVGESGPGGLVLGMISGGVPLGIAAWLLNRWNQPVMDLIIALTSLVIGSAFAFLVWTLAAAKYANIK